MAVINNNEPNNPRSSIQIVKDHIRNGNVRYVMSSYISIVHLLAIWGLWRVITLQCRLVTIGIAIAFYILGGLGITAGAHRLWAHRSYEASSGLRFFLMLCNSIANQGSIYHWTRDHRTHHIHSDTDSDPHNSGRGIFFAHCGWLFLKKDKKVVEAGNLLDLADIKADPVVRLQTYLNPYLPLYFSFILPGQLAFKSGDTFINGMLIAGFLRYVLCLHATWTVNSIAHFYGYRPYDKTIAPVEAFSVAVVALGEGWHNWHHTYPYDYACSEYGISKRFNPTKAFIDFCSFFGFVSNKRRATKYWERKKKLQ